MSNIHPTALVSPDAIVPASTIVGPFSIIDPGVTLGENCLIDAHVRLCQGVTMGSANKVGHGAVIGGNPQDLSFDPDIHSGVSIGNGNFFGEYVTIHRSTHPDGNTIIGNDNFLMGVSHLAHDVVIGNKNVLANNAMVAGHVHMGNNIFMGGGAGYHQFIRVGDYSIIQGNGGATRDIPPYCIAHQINQLSGLNTIGLKRAGFTPEERKEIKKAYAILFQTQKSRADSLAEADSHSWTPAGQRLIDAVRSPSPKGILTR
ncbi:MAG: acyl-ACP--UDP-N-acetylglucosamine O-acyltransferase [Verrucomicrobiaceae bacterium]